VRVAYVAGFFKHVLPELQRRLKAQLESGAVVWIPPYGRTDELNINRFKGDFLSAVSRGARDILICLFFMRGKDYVLETVRSIVELGKTRSPGLNVEFEIFKSARDADGVIAKIAAFEPDTRTQSPGSLEDLPQWILEQHGQRVVLHPRAVNAVKKSQYEDIALIYSAIDLLGVEYWNMRMSTTENATTQREAWEMKLKELELDFSPAITSSRAGEQGDEYRVAYPIGTDQKRLLEHHLCKGSDREERFCMRIYFFWDDVAKRVVIGWLPSHLDTRST
jgi:hypothetical protein